MKKLYWYYKNVFPLALLSLWLMLENLYTLQKLARIKNSTWRSEAWKSSWFFYSILVYSVRGWCLKENRFLRNGLVGSGYTTFSVDKYAIVHFFSFLNIPRWRKYDGLTEKDDYLWLGLLLLVRDRPARFPFCIVKQNCCNNFLDCPRISGTAAFCPLVCIIVTSYGTGLNLLCVMYMSVSYRVFTCATAEMSSFYTTQRIQDTTSYCLSHRTWAFPPAFYNIKTILLDGMSMVCRKVKPETFVVQYRSEILDHYTSLCRGPSVSCPQHLCCSFVAAHQKAAQLQKAGGLTVSMQHVYLLRQC